VAVPAVIIAIFPRGDDDDDIPQIVKMSGQRRIKQEREFVWKPLMWHPHPTAIYGDGGSLKSYLVLALLQSVAAGDKFFLGFEIPKKRRVLFVDFVLDLDELTRRSYAVADGTLGSCRTRIRTWTN
jgi:hypothetical protein